MSRARSASRRRSALRRACSRPRGRGAQAPRRAAPQRTSSCRRSSSTLRGGRVPAVGGAAGKGAAVVLSDRDRRDGQGRRRDGRSSRRAPRSTPPRVAAARQFVFEPALVDGKRHPGEDHVPLRLHVHREARQEDHGRLRGRRARPRDQAADAPTCASRSTPGSRRSPTSRASSASPTSPPGEHAVTLSGETARHRGHHRDVRGRARSIDATYEVDPKKEKSGRTPTRRRRSSSPRRASRSRSSRPRCRPSRRRSVPGTQGDVLKVVENLPGVARAAAGSGALVVWGSAPQDTRVYVDGVHVPRLYHDGGYRSIVQLGLRAVGRARPRRLRRRVRARARRPGHRRAEAARRGGHPRQRRAPTPSTRRPSVRAKVADNLHVAVAARKSYLDSRPVERHVGERRRVSSPSRVLGRAGARRLRPRAARDASRSAGSSRRDRTTRHAAQPRPGAHRRARRPAPTSTASTLRYEKHMADGAVVEVVAVVRDQLHVASPTRTAPPPPTLTNNSHDLSACAPAGAGRSSTSCAATSGSTREAHDRRACTATGRSARRRARATSTSSARPPPAQINSDDWKTVIGSVAPYAEGDISLLDDTLHIVPGARFEPFITSTNKIAPARRRAPRTSAYTREDAESSSRASRVRYAFTPRDHRARRPSASTTRRRSPRTSRPSSALRRSGSPTAQHYLAGGVVPAHADRSRSR